MYVNALRKTTLTRSKLQTVLITSIQTEPILTSVSRSNLTLSRHQSSLAWRFRGISGNLARGIHANRLFPMILADTAGATCTPDDFLGCCFGRPSLLAKCIDLDVLLCKAAVQILPTDVGMFHTPLLKATTHHRYNATNMSSFPQAPRSND